MPLICADIKTNPIPLHHLPVHLESNNADQVLSPSLALC
jgi:hypothetical protein